jgi:hypothetical protein
MANNEMLSRQIHSSDGNEYFPLYVDLFSLFSVSQYRDVINGDDTTYTTREQDICILRGKLMSLSV